jgi:hypothetical protein
MQKYLQQDATVYSSCALHDPLLSLTDFHQSLQNRTKENKQAAAAQKCISSRWRLESMGKKKIDNTRWSMPEMHYGNGEKQRTMPPPDVQRNTYQQL